MICSYTHFFGIISCIRVSCVDDRLPSGRSTPADPQSPVPLVLARSFSVQLHEHFVCQRRVPDRREECRASLAKALIPTKLSCLPSFRDMFVCQNPSDSSSSTNKKNAQPLCPKELQLAAECLEVSACRSTSDAWVWPCRVKRTTVGAGVGWQ